MQELWGQPVVWKYSSGAWEFGQLNSAVRHITLYPHLRQKPIYSSSSSIEVLYSVEKVYFA